MNAIDQKRFFRGFGWLPLLLKFGMPASLVFLPLFAIFESVFPWHAASDLLSRYQNQSPIAIAFAYRGYATPKGYESVVSHAYLLYPSWKVVEVQKRNDGRPIIHDEPQYVLAFYVSWIVASIFGTWWFWFRRRDRVRG